MLEALGAFNHCGRTKQAYDHVKGAFGRVSMLNAIMKKYGYAAAEKAAKISVVFLHASGKGNFSIEIVCIYFI